MKNSNSALDGLGDVDLMSQHPDDDATNLKPGPGKESFKVAQYFKSQINSYDQAAKRWKKRAASIIKRYRDERNRIDEEGQRRMNLLWANIKVMKPAIYSQCPTPVVDRKFLDRDPVGRLSSQILERSLQNELEQSGFHSAMNMAVLDRLLPGKGIVWARYVPKIGEGISIPAPTKNGAEDPLCKIGEETKDKKLTDEDDKEEQLEESNDQVISEKIEIDYVDWDDFGHIPVKARTWQEVQCIYKKVHISKKEAIERFGKEIGKKLRPDSEPKVLTERQTYADTSVFEDSNERNITIYELWNKSDMRAYWICTGYDYLCDVVDDPLELTGFFPVPPPLMSTTTNDTLFPVPDFIEYQDQAIQIDELTQRIAMLSKSCKVAGVYNAANTQINRIFNESIENELIPVDQWAMFADAGGLKGVIDFIPLDTIQSCIETLMKVRQQAMIDLDQVTGISDIIRGTSDSRETLGGLRLKNNNAGTRLTESQEDVARFARDVIKIMAEIACKHFSDETLIESSGILFEDALQPDTVLREVQSMASNMAPQQAPGAPKALPPPAAGAPQQGQQPLPAAPGSNVVPFPGGQQQAPQKPMMQPPPPDPQILIMMKVGKALELLRKDVTRGYRIDIETDSTIFGDKAQNKENATEFLGALSSYMQQAEGAMQLPEILPLYAKSIQWAVRQFRVGRDLESEIDNFCEAISKKAKQMIENPQPSAEDKKANAEVQRIQLEAKSQQENDQRAAQIQQSNDQRDAQMQQQKNAAEVQKMQLESQLEEKRMQMELAQMQMDMEMKREEHRIKLQELRANLHVKGQEAVIDIHKSKMDLQSREKEHELDKKELKHKEAEQNVKHKHKQTEQNKSHKDKMKAKKAS